MRYVLFRIGLYDSGATNMNQRMHRSLSPFAMLKALDDRCEPCQLQTTVQNEAKSTSTFSGFLGQIDSAGR